MPSPPTSSVRDGWSASEECRHPRQRIGCAPALDLDGDHRAARLQDEVDLAVAVAPVVHGAVASHLREVIEAALAHVVQNKVEAACARSDLFDRRRRLMDDWSAYLASEGR